MGEIKIVGPDKIHGYPYLVCKNNRIYDGVEAETRKISGYYSDYLVLCEACRA